MAGVNPAVLRWARETAGLSVADAAQKFGFKDTKKGTAVDRMAALEGGEIAPSSAHLAKAAKVYRRPLITFFLPTPPAPAAGVADFRTLPDLADGKSEANLQALLRDVRLRQSLVRDVLEDEEAEAKSFPGSLRRTHGVEGCRARLEAAIGWQADKFRSAASAEKAFDYLRRQVEAIGVYVLLIGDLGNYLSAIEVETYRGFALADDLAPFIVINDQDAQSAWSFTLLHELVHIGLGQSGVSGKVIEGDDERFCNDVASAVLIPSAELATLDVGGLDEEATKVAISRFARLYRVSGSMVAYRLFLDGQLSRDDWKAVSHAFLDDWRRSKAARKETQRGAPDFYTVRRHRLGQALLSVVKRSVDGGLLTPVRAARVLGVSPRGVDPLLSGRAS